MANKPSSAGACSGCRKIFQNLHVAQIRNPCLSQAVSLSADQWKVRPSASGIPELMTAILHLFFSYYE